MLHQQHGYRILATSSASQSSSSLSSRSFFILHKRVQRKILLVLASLAFVVIIYLFLPGIQSAYNSFANNQANMQRTKIFSRYYEEESKLQITAPEWNELKDELSKELDGTIFTSALHLRLYKKLRTVYGNSNQPSVFDYGYQTYRQLEAKLFPWLLRHKTVDEIIQDTKQERGIVMATGQSYFPMAIHAIKSLRLWNCTLPVQVFHLGGNDLSIESIEYLNQMENVTTIDIGTIFNQTILNLRGWDIKPFAILGSSFRETILIDADVVFAESPDQFFTLEDYQRTGALFFYDRFFKSKKKIDFESWFKRIIPFPHSKRLKSTLMYRGLSEHEQESGMVVVNKEKHLVGLLATCRLNCPKERREIHSKTHGEKETYWIGFEIIGEDYAYGEPQAGLVGECARIIQTRELFMCGHLAHFDRNGNLLWFNDGIVDNKRDAKLKLKVGKFIHYESVGEWSGMCMKPKELKWIPSEKTQIIDELKEIWVADPLHA